jgi:hypothetical protein
MDSDKELAAKIARMEEAIDNCYRTRARRARLELGELESRPLSEEERDKLSERLGDGVGTRAKRRRELEEMQLETLEAKVEEVERTRARRGRTTGASKLTGSTLDRELKGPGLKSFKGLRHLFCCVHFTCKNLRQLKGCRRTTASRKAAK